MPMKMLFCSDLHLEKSFSSSPSVKEELKEARFLTLEKLIEKAETEKAELFLIGGDLFDTLRISAKSLKRTADILSKFSGLVYILPGNHDYLSLENDGLWQNFKKFSGENTTVLDEMKPFTDQIGGKSVSFYPAPCDDKHSPTNRSDWVSRESLTESNFHIGMAHGSLVGIAPDQNELYYKMDERSLSASAVDIWLLGHVHQPYPKNPSRESKVFYAGTPEPDGFNRNHHGTAWIFTIQDDKSILSELLENTGKYSFLELDLELQSGEDLKARLAEIHTQYQNDVLLRLNLSGRLTREENLSLNQRIREIQNDFFFLQVENNIREKIDEKWIEKHFSRDSFPEKLLLSLLSEGDEEAVFEAVCLLEESESGAAR